MTSLRVIPVAFSFLLVTLIASCSPSTNPESKASSSATVEGEHGHKPSVHGGILVSIGLDKYHVEAVFQQGGKLRLYMLGADESKVIDVETQTLSAVVKVGSLKESMPFELKADPQPHDRSGHTSQFVGELPPTAFGKPLIITIPSVRIGNERFRVAFNSEEAHTEAAMPAKLGSEEERKLFLTAGGAYTEADIKANGAIPTVKFKGIRAEHDNHPKPGDKICPITMTKANPKFAWVIGGKTYEFCCTPCIEEFVALAKEKPGDIKDPKDYVK